MEFVMVKTITKIRQTIVGAVLLDIMQLNDAKTLAKSNTIETNPRIVCTESNMGV